MQADEARELAMSDEQDKVKCGCDEYPECTHVLYWFQGFKAGALEARLAALEEAAQLAEGQLIYTGPGNFDPEPIQRCLALAIRSLAERASKGAAK